MGDCPLFGFSSHVWTSYGDIRISLLPLSSKLTSPMAQPLSAFSCCICHNCGAQPLPSLFLPCFPFLECVIPLLCWFSPVLHPSWLAAASPSLDLAPEPSDPGNVILDLSGGQGTFLFAHFLLCFIKATFFIYFLRKGPGEKTVREGLGPVLKNLLRYGQLKPGLSTLGRYLQAGLELTKRPLASYSLTFPRLG